MVDVLQIFSFENGAEGSSTESRRAVSREKLNFAASSWLKSLALKIFSISDVSSA